MKPIRFITLSIVFLPMLLAARINMPHVENYSVNQYHAGTQNWGVAQGSDGIIYFANNNGLLSFDGQKWTLHKMPSGIRLRSLLVDGERIYCGGFQEFGYWQKDAFGKLIYHSVSEKFDKFELHNDEIWSIAKSDGTIYFQSFSSYFSYDGETIDGFKLNMTPLSFVSAGDCVYANVNDRGLFRLCADGFEQLVGQEQTQGSEITTVIPWSDGRLLLGTAGSGLFLYDSGRCIPWAAESRTDLSAAQINRGTSVPGEICIIGTIHDGVYAFDGEGRFLWKSNKESAGHHNTVLGLSLDRAGNVWAGLDNGITLIQPTIPFRFSAKEFEQIGTVYCAAWSEPYLYLGTNQGLYYVDFGRGGEPVRIQNIRGQVWGIDNYDGQLIGGYNEGAFRINGPRAERLSSIHGGSSLRRFTHNGKDYLLQGTYTHLVVYKQGAKGVWEYYRTVNRFINPIKQIEIDHNNIIWASHVERGLFRLRLDRELKDVQESKLYVTLSDDNPQERITIAKLGGRIIFANGIQLYTYDDIAGEIVPFDKLNAQLGEFAALRRIIPVDEGRYWLVKDDAFALISLNGDRVAFLSRVPFSVLDNQLVYGYENAIALSPDKYLFCLQNGVCLYDYERQQTANGAPLRLVLKSVTVSRPGAGPMPLPLSETPQRLAYEKDYTFTFDIAYPEYQDRNHYFEYRLKGVENSWNRGSGAGVFEYSRIGYGEQTFEVGVYSAVGRELDRLSYTFVVKPPWYASWGAYLIYLFLFVLLLWVMRWYVNYRIAVHRRKMEQEQYRLQREEEERRQHKIVQLENEKLEAEVVHKSKELASSTMLIINKNRMLQKLKEEIMEQKKTLGQQYPNKYYDKIIRAIDEYIGTDDDWSLFQANFDRIHEGFFRNLKARYPELTAGDLKLCAYLRLNLSTKDIANLLNISVRGVEVARYRLRKKLDIVQEENLVEFMIEFK